MPGEYHMAVCSAHPRNTHSAPKKNFMSKNVLNSRILERERGTREGKGLGDIWAFRWPRCMLEHHHVIPLGT